MSSSSHNQPVIVWAFFSNHSIVGCRSFLHLEKYFSFMAAFKTYYISGRKKCFKVIADEAAFNLIQSSLLHWCQGLLVFKMPGVDSYRPHYLLIAAVCFQSQKNYMVQDKPIASSTGCTVLQYHILRLSDCFVNFLLFINWLFESLQLFSLNKIN